MTFESALLRDFEPLEESFNRLNHSPAGCGSVNGSRLKINRQRLADLLGFDGLIQHARDAMWCVDIPLENYSNLVAISVNINRLIEEL